uniref:Mismatch repair endonuclease PMS2 n=1 Tax=Timema poppense TaxID=170557 RepID=A0A7R9DD00_TIMPO|nr:unnamed protein product [Timema poppensis]
MEIEFASSATTEKSGMIQAINKDTVHQICSGQVVLNLATAVKELVENSLDAGATSIDVRLKEFGSELIEVTDNGCGVEEHSFQGLTLKHHTSKLREFSDLTTVETFGFRGEALSSLCALSNLTIITCHKGAPCGTKLEFDHKGLITSCRSHARQSSELCSNLLYAYCLVSIEVKITCVNQNNKGGRTMVVTTQGSSSVRENIAAVFGTKQVCSKSYSIDQSTACSTRCSCADESVHCATVRSIVRNCHGCLSQLQTILDLPTEPPEDEVLKELGAPPQMVEDKDLFQLEGCVSSCAHGAGRATSDRQFYYINSRPCEPTKVIKLVNEVYHQFNKHQFPFAFINLKISRHNVDVNVTPDKRQVFLDKEKLILATVKACLLRIYEGVTSTLPLDNCAKRTSPPTPGGLHTMMKQWGRDPATPLGRGLKRSLQQTPGRNRGTPKQLCMSDFIKRSAVSPSDSLDNIESSKSLANTSTTDIEQNHTLQQESSADHLINSLQQETSADSIINSLQQETSADSIINCLQQETSADHLINGLQQETRADHFINSLQQETSADSIINSLQQETSTYHLINVLQQETSADPIINSLQQETSTYHLINGLQQETSADYLINSLQQETSADPIINSLQQETSADPIINSLQQETSAYPIINSLQQETSADHLINGLQQETSADPIINSLQQETSANHLLNKLQVPYSNGVKHKSYNSATKIGIRQISENTMERNLLLSASRLPQTAGKEHSSVAKATRSFQLVPTTIASNGHPAFIEETTGNSVNDESSAVESCGVWLTQEVESIEETTGNSVNDESSAVESCGVWLTQEVESIEKLQTDETRGTHTVRPVSQVSVTLDGVRKLLESREKRRNRWTAAPVVNKFHADINPSKNTIAEQELKKEISKDMFAKMSIVGQFNLGFIVVRLRADLFIIDQHASDEKYNFEKLQRDTALRNQRLVIPQKLELTAVNEGILIENVEIFRNNGFDFLIDKEAESSRRVRLTAIPMSKNWHFGKEDIDELLFMLQDSPHTMCRPSRVRAMFASRACRKSIMIGTALNLSDMRRLVDHMGEMDQPWVGFIYNWDLPFLVKLSTRQTNHEALGQPQPHSRLAHTAFNHVTLGQPQPHSRLAHTAFNYVTLDQPQLLSRLAHTAFNYETLGQAQLLSRLAHTAFNYETLGQPQPHSRLAHTAFNYETLGQPQPHSRLAHTAFNYETLGQPQPHSRLAHTAFNYETLGQPQPHSRLAHTAFNYETLGQPQPHSRLAHTAFNYETLGQPQPHSRLAHTAFNYETLGQPQPHSRLAHTAFNYETLGQPQPHSRLAHTAFNYETLGQPQPHSRLAHTAFNYETLGQPQPHSRLAHTAFNYETLGQPQPHSRLAHTAFNYETLGQPQPHSRLAHTAFNYETLGQPQPHSRLAHTAFNYETLGQPQPHSRLAHTAFNYETLGQPQPHSRLAHTAFNYETLGQPQPHSRLAHTAFNYETLGQPQPHSRLAHTAFNYETLGQAQPHSRLAHTAFNYDTLGQAQLLSRLETSKKLSVFSSQLY